MPDDRLSRRAFLTRFAREAARKLASLFPEIPLPSRPGDAPAPFSPATPSLQIFTQGGMISVTTGLLRVEVDGDTGLWNFLYDPDPLLGLRGVAFGAVVAGQTILSTGEALRTLQTDPFQDDLGKGLEIQLILEGFDLLASLTLIVRVYESASSATIRARLVAGRQTLPLEELILLFLEKGQGGKITFGQDVRSARIFLDSGGERGWSVVGLCPEEEAEHTSNGVCVLYDEAVPLAISTGFLAAPEGDTWIRVSCQAEACPQEMSAAHLYPGRELAPEACVKSKPLWLDMRPSPLNALEEYGRTLWRIHRSQLPQEIAHGWTSGCISDRDVDEDLVLANARVIAQNLRSYGVHRIQIDAPISSDRFPHGIGGLADRMREMGLQLDTGPSSRPQPAPVTYGSLRSDLARSIRQMAGSFYRHPAFRPPPSEALIVRGGTENEARIRCLLAAFSGEPVLLGDDLASLAPERLSLLSLCLPSWGQAARPLDLFATGATDYPQIWSLTIERDWGLWHVVGLLNLEPEPQEIAVSFCHLGLEAGTELLAFEFWERRFLGRHRDSLSVAVPGNDVRLLALHLIPSHPLLIATDMHLTMGGVEVLDALWSYENQTLSGHARRTPGARGRVFLYMPDSCTLLPTDDGFLYEESIVAVDLDFGETGEAAWQVRFAQG